MTKQKGVLNLVSFTVLCMRSHKIVLWEYLHTYRKLKIAIYRRVHTHTYTHAHTDSHTEPFVEIKSLILYLI